MKYVRETEEKKKTIVGSMPKNSLPLFSE